VVQWDFAPVYILFFLINSSKILYAFNLFFFSDVALRYWVIRAMLSTKNESHNNASKFQHAWTIDYIIHFNCPLYLRYIDRIPHTIDYPMKLATTSIKPIKIFFSWVNIGKKWFYIHTILVEESLVDYLLDAIFMVLTGILTNFRL